LWASAESEAGLAGRVRWGLWAGLGLASGLAAVLLTYADYGFTWDEAVHARYGELVLRYFRSGFRDRTCDSFQDLLRYYGPLPDLVPALLYGSRAADKFEFRHLFFGLVALLNLPVIALYGRLLGGARVALYAALAAAMLPRYSGHWFNNSKDVPFALATAWLLYCAAASLHRGDFRGRRVLLCGVALGLCLCVRPGGFPLLMAYLGGLAGLWLALGRPWAEGLRAASAGSLLLRGLGVVLIGWTLMVLPWPWAHRDPIGHPIQAMGVAASLPVAVPVLFDGTVYSSRELPWRYLFQYLGITTPPSLLLLALVGIGACARRALDRSAGRGRFVCAATLLWLALPLGLFLALRLNLFNGYRHVLFILPALAVLAGVGAAWTFEALARVAGPSLARAAVLIAVLLPLPELIRLHPYQAVYFNGLAGGLRGAADRYDMDYWLSSYREAMEWVNERVRQRPEQKVGVVLFGDVYLDDFARRYFERNVVPMRILSGSALPRLPPGAEFYIASRFLRGDLYFPDMPVLHKIGRDGAVFTVIKGRPEAAR
jgi:hypothetical protein